MARINTNRPGATIYNGMAVDVVRAVTPFDGPSFNEKTPQVIVRHQGNDLYFFADEVEMSGDEREGLEKQLKEDRERWDKGQEAGRKNVEGKNAMFEAQGERMDKLREKEQARAREKEQDEERRRQGKEGIPDAMSGGMAGGTPQGVEAQRAERQAIDERAGNANRLPTDPPATQGRGSSLGPLPTTTIPGEDAPAPLPHGAQVPGGSPASDNAAGMLDTSKSGRATQARENLKDEGKQGG